MTNPRTLLFRCSRIHVALSFDDKPSTDKPRTTINIRPPLVPSGVRGEHRCEERAWVFECRRQESSTSRCNSSGVLAK